MTKVTCDACGKGIACGDDSWIPASHARFYDKEYELCLGCYKLMKNRQMELDEISHQIFITEFSCEGKGNDKEETESSYQGS